MAASKGWRPALWILAIAWMGMISVASAVAGTRNTIGDLTVQPGDSPAATKVTIAGSASATFNVYRLERPNRVVIDVSGADLSAAVRGAESAATITSSTWAVSQVSAQQLADNGSQVRVVVTMARPGTYDVKAVGNNIIVTVTARDLPVATPGDGDLTQAKAEIAKAKADTVAARKDADAAKAEAAAARAEAQAAKATAEADVARTKAELARAEKALKATKGSDKSERGLAELAVADAKTQKDRADAALAESKATMAQAQAKTTEAAKYRREAALAYARAEKQALEASTLRDEVAKAKRDADVARAETQAAKAQTAQAKSEALAAATQAKTAQSDAERSRREAAAATSAAERAKREAEVAKEEAKQAKAAIVKTYEQGVITLASAPGNGLPLATPAAATVRTAIPRPVVSSFGATAAPITQTSVAQATTGKRRVFRGQTVNLNVKEAPIHDLLRLLADVGRVNIVVPDTLSDKVTVKMNKVPWDQALEVILSSKGLWYRREGNLLRIDQRKILDDEDRAEAERVAMRVAQEAPEPRILTLNYADASGTKSRLEKLLSPKGSIEIDDRTNSLVVTDIRAHRAKIEAFARELDTQTPQISIEARIVEARSSFSREFGIQWGGGRAVSQGLSVLGGAADNAPTLGLNTDVVDPNYAVNLPAASNAGIGFTLPKVFGIDLSLRLSAAEENGTARVISSPKVTVMNNTAASIREGVQIPVQVVSASGTNTQFVPAELNLTVTPYVSQQDCAVALDVSVSKNEPDFSQTGARGDPTIRNKEVKTKVLVADGETSVIGGIYTRNTGTSWKKVPIFSDIPVIGWLFKNKRTTDSRSELLIFITPKITNRAALSCVNAPKD